MSLDRARAALRAPGLDDRIMVLDHSSATVELAATAVGCEPARIAKTLSFLVQGHPVLVVTAGDVRVSNPLFRQTFGVKARMIPADQVEDLVGHAVGGVCPFGVEDGVEVHLDRSLQRFDAVYPACGSANSCVHLTLDQLERVSGSAGWVNVTQPPAA